MSTQRIIEGYTKNYREVHKELENWCMVESMGHL